MKISSPGGLGGAGKQGAEHHGVSAGNQCLANLAGVLHTAVSNQRHTCRDSCLSGLVDSGHLGNTNTGDDAGGADGAGANANLHAVSASVDDSLCAQAGCSLATDDVHVCCGGVLFRRAIMSSTPWE